MYANTSILSQYPADGSKYIAPMYVPYQRTRVPTKGSGCYQDINTWKKQGSPYLVNPDQVRRGWNMDFLKIHPNDPCPAGWKDNGDGICVRVRQEGHKSSFYTSDQFAVKYQYHDGYSSGRQNPKLQPKTPTSPFQNRSVNPHTGKYVEYHIAKPNKAANKYGGNPSRYSYLGRP